MSNCESGVSAPFLCIMCRLHPVHCTANFSSARLAPWPYTDAKSDCSSTPVGDSSPEATPVSELPGKGATHLCHPCLSNCQPRQRHPRPNRTRPDCGRRPSLSQFDPCFLITKFAHRLHRMSFSNLLLTLFLYAILFTSQVSYHFSLFPRHCPP